jgi:nickel transport protein
MSAPLSRILTAAAVLLAAAGLLGLVPASATAHGVNVFCWVKGDTVQCECSFSHDSPVREGRYEVRAEETGALLVNGTTDREGTFSFPVPEKARKRGWDLRVVCDAGSGHRSFWIVKSQEFSGGSQPPDSSASPASDQGKNRSPASAADGAPGSPQPPTGDRLQEMLRQTLAEELTPIRRELARMRKNRQGRVRDVLAGIGYILGFVGLALYFKSRGK